MHNYIMYHHVTKNANYAAVAIDMTLLYDISIQHRKYSITHCVKHLTMTSNVRHQTSGVVLNQTLVL